MENLQAEVQEMEFLQFSKGLSFMRKEDFAEWLLKSFCHFATHLEDFAIAMQMFSLAHRPVRLGKLCDSLNFYYV